MTQMFQVHVESLEFPHGAGQLLTVSIFQRLPRQPTSCEGFPGRQ
jgi:hypothetical protein